MRIVNRSDFLALPPGTVYAKYSSLGIFGKICIKDDTCHNDWYYQELLNVKYDDSVEFADVMQLAEQSSSYEVELDLDCMGRDGYFEEDERFAALSRQDVESIITRLQEALA